MDSNVSTTLSSSQNPPKQHNDERDFLDHLETYLAKRDGVDKLLQISNYVTKIILASSILPETMPLTSQLKRYQSNIILTRKAYKLGKFIQPINAFRNSSTFQSKEDFVLSVIASGGDCLSLFIEQFIWLAKLGVIDGKHLPNLEKISAWAELVGYIGSISLTLREWIAISAQNEHNKMMLVKKLSIFQDLSGLLMALADIRDGKGRLSEPLLLASAGLFSTLITSYKIWKSC